VLQNIGDRTFFIGFRCDVVKKGSITWSLTLREKSRLERAFENRVLRRMYVTERDGVKRDWTTLRNKELNDLYCSPNVIGVIESRRMRWAGHVARGESRSAYKVLVGKPKGN